MKRNGRKRAVLAFLASQKRPATAAQIAWHTRYRAGRGIYSHLARYARWGLLARSRGPDGRLRFRLAKRGRARLAWLSRNS